MGRGLTYLIFGFFWPILTNFSRFGWPQPILPWKSSNLLQISPEKAWNDWMKPPRIVWASLFFSNNCKKPFKSCCAINVLLVSEIQNYKKQKKKFTTLFSPQKIPQLRTLKLQTIAQKLLFDFGPKKWQTSRLIQIRLVPKWAQILGLILGQPPQSKLKFRLISIQFDYTPFHGCFLCGCIFILCQVAIFWLKKVQFSSQKCNFYLWKILHCNFWKTGKKKKEITQNNKNATLPLYVFCLPKQNEFFVGLF